MVASSSSRTSSPKKCRIFSAFSDLNCLLAQAPPRPGSNRVTIEVGRRNGRIAGEIPLELTDAELSVRYAYPDGPWEGDANRSG